MSIQRGDARRATLTHEHNRLRSLYNRRSTQRPTSLHIRGHRLIAENPDGGHVQTYALRSPDTDDVLVVELDHFEFADDLVRFIDTAISLGFDQARDWARKTPTVGWSA